MIRVDHTNTFSEDELIELVSFLERLQVVDRPFEKPGTQAWALGQSMALESLVGATKALRGLATRRARNSKVAANILQTYVPRNEHWVGIVTLPESDIFDDPEIIAEVAELKRSVAAISLSPADQQRGFEIVNPLYAGGERAAVSARLNSRILNARTIPAEFRNLPEGTTISAPKRTHDVLAYLLLSDRKTTDDQKFALRSDLDPDSDLSCVLAPSTYFEGIVLNEAHRSLIVEQHTANGRFEFSRPNEDFQAFLADGLPSLDQYPIGNHVGISTLAISRDHRPVFFQQNVDQLVGARSMVVTGSGSVDLKDIRDSADRTDLLSILRFSCYREYFEEGHAEVIPDVDSHAIPPTSASEFSKTADVAGRNYRRRRSAGVVITGFFRWISRLGKPEFTALYRSRQNAVDIRADGKEVLAYDIADTCPKIEKVSDFIALEEWLEDATDNRTIAPLSLSSAMTIRNAATIARSPDAEVLANRLGLDAG